MTVRKYSSISQETTLTSTLNAGDSTMVVASAVALLAGITPAVGETFTVVIDPDTSLEEIVDIISPSAPGSTTLTIQRNIDSTAAISHSAGAKVRHMAIGRDFREANNHQEKVTGLVHGLTIADVVEVTDTGTVSTQMIASSAVTTVKVADSAITLAKLADSSVTSAKIADGTIVNTDINTSAGIDKTKISGTAVTLSDTGTVTSVMIENGTITNTDINSAAGIAYSKLALTGLITSSDIADGTIVNGDISASAAIALSKLATDPLARANHTGTQTSSTISNFDTQVRTSKVTDLTAPTGSFSMNSQKITALATPTASTDASTKGYVDTQITNLVGAAPSTLDTLAEIAAAINADPNLYATLNNGKLNRDGTQAMTGALPMGTFKVTGVGDPTNAQDAATKNYVDTGVNSGVVAAAASATAAASSATSASGSATSATNSATSATASASSATSSASSATASQSAAATSATSAAVSAAAASASQASASTSATNAQGSQTSAGSSATDAAANATAASSSASGASVSATNSATSATASALSATSAATSATASSTSASNASTSASNALTSETNAGTSAASASTNASNAATSATSAAASATAAGTSATAAATSATNAAASYDNFDDRYLGSKSSAPTVDNDGNALLVGAIYWNSSLGNMYVWSGSAWIQIATTSTYGAPTLGSTTINSGTTYSTIAGLTLSGGLATADPSTALGLATKQYVDAVTTQINYHQAVVAASVTNLGVTYSNGSSGVGATLTADTNRAFNTLDGQSVSVGGRVLIKDQTTQLQNGIYTLTNNGSGSAPWVLTRATDSDNNPEGEMRNGDELSCSGGTVNNGKSFINSTIVDPIVIGTTSISFSEYYSGLPSQTSNSGKYLTTDGTTPSWGTVAGYSAPTLGSTSIASGSTNTSVTGLTLTNGNIKETPAGFAAIGSDGIAFSADSALWTRPVSTASFGAVAFADGKWVAVPGFGNTARYSTDGVTWSSATLPASKPWSAITYGNGRFLAIDNNPSAYSAYSTDGITWVAGGAPTYGFFYGGPSLTYGANGFLVAGKESAGSISTDGVTWTSSTLPATGGVDYDGAAAYGAGKYVVLAGGLSSGPSNLTAYSSDGTTWSQGAMPSSDTWISAAFGNGKFVAVAWNSNAAAYSTDGITWTAATLPATSQWTTLTFGNNKFFAISDIGVTASSVDGITWTSGTIITGQYYSAAYGVSTAGASVGLPGQVITSNGTDISWSTLPIDYVAPTIGTTTIYSGATISNLSDLTINGSAPVTNASILQNSTTSTAASGAGFRGIPQIASTTGSYTISQFDAGKHIYASATRTVTIPSNSSVAFPVGTTIAFIAGTGATMSIAITTDTMYLAGLGTTGTRTLAPFGMATAVKITSTAWLISGNGLS